MPARRWGTRRLGPFHLLVHALTPDVSIRIDPDRFEFSAAGRAATLEPVLYLTGTAPDQRIAAVGDSVAPPGPYTRLAFLDPSLPSEGPVTRLEALEAFLRYGFALVLKRVLLARPSVTVSGADSLSVALGDGAEEVLARALESAGAHQVTFADPPAA